MRARAATHAVTGRPSRQARGSVRSPRMPCDFAVAPLARVAGMVPGAGEAVVAVACTAGWIARAVEACAGGGPLCPRAACTGPPAVIGP
jgi:citrate synthase